MFELKPSYEDFKKLSETYHIIPVYTEIPADVDTPVSLFYKLFEEDYIFLLESIEGPEKWARYSFLGLKPFLVFQSKYENILIKEKTQEKSFNNEPFSVLKNLFNSFKVYETNELPRFWGGAVGYISYEIINFFEPRVKRGKDVLNFYDIHLVFPEILLVYDRFKHVIKIIGISQVKNDPSLAYFYIQELINSIIDRIKNGKVSPLKIKKELNFEPEIEKEQYIEWVKKAKEYIFAGDIIQVVLSQRFLCEDDILFEPHVSFYIYRALRKVNPSPYMFFLKLKDEILIGSSPEILVRVEGKVVETRPIAGTRKRGKNEEEDKWLEEDLKKDEKELAEHIMLVDLGRNDIGRVCKYGSVEVTELMIVERYSHVMHLVSGVKGILKDGEDMFSSFRAVFPAGTVSGAPKIRAMEIITETEKTVRGPYAGAVGYFGFSGNMDFCITIRTLFQKQNKLYIQTGAGIVADSKPINEYEETLNKAKAMKKAVELFSKGYFL